MEDAPLATFMTTELHILAILLRIDIGYKCDTSHNPGTGDFHGCHSTGNKDKGYSIEERVTLAPLGHV